MAGCGHVWLPADGGRTELSTAWCGECADKLKNERDVLKNSIVRILNAIEIWSTGMSNVIETELKKAK